MKANVSLGNDKIINILLYGMPKSWQREMSCQGFDPLDHDLNTIVSFMERIEETEDFEPGQEEESKKTSPDCKRKRKAKDDKFCMVHGKGSHTMEECKTLLAQTKLIKLKTTERVQQTKWEYKNLTWSRKDEENKDRAKKDLQAFV